MPPISRQSLNTTTGSTQVCHIMTPEATDRLEELKARLTADNRGYTVSTSEVIRRAIMYMEFHTRSNNNTK
jgi:hypothetical protein